MNLVIYKADFEGLLYQMYPWLALEHCSYHCINAIFIVTLLFKGQSTQTVFQG